MKKRLWERQLFDTARCQWCDEITPPTLKSIDHILPRRYGGKDAKKNCVMACMFCNNGRGSLDDAFAHYIVGTYDLERYRSRQATIVEKIGKHFFGKLCCQQKNKPMIDFYQKAYPNQFHYHPFQENL